MIYRVKRLVVMVAVLLVFATAITRAGEIRLKWVPGQDGPTAEGFKVYWGTDSPPTNSVDVGNVLEWEKTDLPDCATYTYHVTAYIGTAESGPSPEVSVFPRPDITNVVDSESGTVAILGNNFDNNVKIYYNVGQGFQQLPAGDVNRVSCTEIRIPDIPLLQVQVANVALPLNTGEPMDTFSQPWPGPTLSVE